MVKITTSLRLVLKHVVTVSLIRLVNAVIIGPTFAVREKAITVGKI